MRPGASSAALKYPEQHAGRATLARDTLATPKDIINEAKNGRMFVLVDDGSENGEGYLVIPAQMATPQAVNFMATHGRGLVCLAITKGRANQLALPMMATRDRPRGSADFAVSIEARVGVTTGISTADRARTIAVAIDAATTARQQQLFRRLLDAGRSLEKEEREDSEKREAKSAQGDQRFDPGNAAVRGRAAARFVEPTWDDLRGLSADERRAIREYFKRINAAKP